MFCTPTDSLLHFLRESIVGTDTLCKKDTFSVSKLDFNALETVINDIHENGKKHMNDHIITIAQVLSTDLQEK